MNYHFVYCIYSPNYNQIYIGRSSNVKSRLLSHFYFDRKGYTSKYKPWRLAYLEKCGSLQEAIMREKQLKSAAGRRFIWEQVRKKFPSGVGFK